VTVWTDRLRSAYATLGLPNNAPRSAVRRQYRLLVKRWHPDRFNGDPDGIREATLRLRAINQAHDTIQNSWDGIARHSQSEDIQESSQREVKAVSFSREEIAEMISAIQETESFFERARRDPWNRCLPLLAAFTDLVWSLWIWDPSRPLNSKSALELSILSSVCFVPFIWSDDKARKAFGWFGFLFCKVCFPLFNALMMRVG
jgi:DnaJ domain